MDARPGPFRLRQSNVPEEATTAHAVKAGPRDAQGSSKAAACGALKPGTTARKAASVKRRAVKRKASAAIAGTKREEEAGCVDCDEPVDVEVVVAPTAVEEGKGLTKLLEEEVQWVMNHKPRAVEHDDEDEEMLRNFYPEPEVFEKEREIMRRGDKALASMKEEFLAFQSWVRAEYNEKGYVAVDDKWLADREQVRQWAYDQFQDMFDRLGLKFSPSHIGDYSDMYATDDE